MSREFKETEKISILRYGELIMRKAREEGKPEDPQEMEKICKDLNFSPAEAIAAVEHLVKKSY